MRRALVGLASLALFGAAVYPGAYQPPGDDDKKGDDKKGGPPRFQLGDLFPPPAKEGLNLTAAQEKDLAALQKMVKERLKKILTAEQQKYLEEFRPPRPGMGDGPDGKDGPDGDKKGKGNRQKGGMDKGDKGDGEKKEGRPERPPTE